MNIKNFCNCFRKLKNKNKKRSMKLKIKKKNSGLD